MAAARTDSLAAEALPTKRLSRREFLYYVWGASAGLLMAGAGGAAIWYALPHERFGIELFKIDPAKLPLPNSIPIDVIDGKFWWANTDKGLLAFSMICPYKGCFFKWIDANIRFECPCCGSKFQLDGTHHRGYGPARRNLDRFVIYVRTPHGFRQTPADGSALDIQDATEIIVDTTKKILGKPS